MSPGWSRRRLLAAALAGAALPGARLAHAAGLARSAGSERRWLELVNTHTGEAVAVAYRDARGFVADALRRLQWVLRDHRVGVQHEIDLALYDQLGDLAIAAAREPRYEIISGYRSATTNERLAQAGRGVAPRSLHVQGRAIDVRLKGLDCAELRDLALAMERGGVGYYRRSDFVHLDTGRVRHWQG